MPRPVTLFTGQWADLSLAELAPKIKAMGYDGVELACWGDHFEVDHALAEPDYVKKKWALLAKHGLKCFAISTHLVGQAVCDLIDERHKAILPADVWGDGKPEGVRQRAAEKMKATARAARKFFDARPGHKGGDDFLPSSTASPAQASGTRFTLFRRRARIFSTRDSPILPDAGCRSSMCLKRRTSTSRSKCIRRKSPSTSPPRNARSTR